MFIVLMGLGLIVLMTTGCGLRDSLGILQAENTASSSTATLAATTPLEGIPLGEWLVDAVDTFVVRQTGQRLPADAQHTLSNAGEFALEVVQEGHTTTTILDPTKAVQGFLTPQRTYHKDGHICRRFSHHTITDDQSEVITGHACRTEQSGWVAVSPPRRHNYTLPPTPEHKDNQIPQSLIIALWTS